jgi:phosphatidylserine/phosphatidylglycerophosphate/cardiolipin synthase-like enzyme
MAGECDVSGANEAAAFTLKIHRGDGMALLGMNWRDGRPPDDLVGFGIEYKEPDGDRFFPVKNRLCFSGVDNRKNPAELSSLRSPIQMFRWVHFPRNAEKDGAFTYRVTPIFMNAQDELIQGEPQQADIELRRETYPGQLNVTFTRGFVSSQAFVDHYGGPEGIKTLLPGKDDEPLHFKPTHPDAEEALEWMGFEARSAVFELLDQAIADPRSQVRVACYDLDVPELVERLEKLGKRLRIIIDDSGAHGEEDSGETLSAARLRITAGDDQVKRQHMLGLQHNKMVVVDAPTVKKAIGGSTNFSWRGLYVQNNNACVVSGESAIGPFMAAFDNFWEHGDSSFGKTPSALWSDLGLDGIDARVTFSPHAAGNAVLQSIADDIDTTASCLFYSLAFLSQTAGAIPDALERVTNKDGIFVYGISDKQAAIAVRKPDGNVRSVKASALTKTIPSPFKEEASGLAGGVGTRMHHKFVVIDFDKPEARVWFGSYNFSNPADRKNGENLLIVRDRRVAVSYMIEALRIFDHYAFRVAQEDAKTAKTSLALARPPRAPDEQPWWAPFYDNPQKARDRQLFA